LVSIRDFIDYYELLGVSPRASKELINRAYRISAKDAHPDVGGSEASFILLHKAYETLTDDLLRSDYDKTYYRMEALKYNQMHTRKQSDEEPINSNNPTSNKRETVRNNSNSEDWNRKLIPKVVVSGINLLSISAKIVSGLSNKIGTLLIY